MNSNYKITVNNKIDFLLNQEEVQNLDIVQEKNLKFHLLHRHKSYQAELMQADFHKKTYVVTVNGNTYQIKITNGLDLIIEKMGFSEGSSKKINLVYAPMPGIIIALQVKEGDKVKEGDTLVILEAMKMENAIICNKNGIVKSVFVSSGVTVEKGKLLIELE